MTGNAAPSTSPAANNQILIIYNYPVTGAEARDLAKPFEYVCAAALLNATAAANGPKRPRETSGSGWLEQGKAGNRGRELFTAGYGRTQRVVHRGQDYRYKLGGHV